MPCVSRTCVNAVRTTLDGFRSRPGVPTPADRAVLERLEAALARAQRMPVDCLFDDSCVRRHGTDDAARVPGQPAATSPAEAGTTTAG